MTSSTAFSLILSVLCLLGSLPAQDRSDPDHIADPTVHRVACIGDSITFGSGLSDKWHASWPAILDQMITGGAKNFGVSGATLLREGNKPIWKQKAFAAALDYQPTTVFVVLGTNDSKSANWKHKSSFEGDLTEMVHRLRILKSAPRVLLCLPPPAWTRGKGIDGKRILDEVIPAIRRVAQRERCQLLDLHTPMLSHKGWFGDGVHPNAFGAEFIAHRAYEALMQADKPINFATVAAPAVEFRGKSAGWGGGTWWDDYQKTEKVIQDHPDLELVFLGDSITQGLTGAQDRLSHAGGKRLFDRYYGRYKAAGLGISGDRVEHLLYRATKGGLGKLHPKVLVLMIGVNNLGLRQNTGEEIAAGTRLLVTVLQGLMPRTKILLLGCFPSKNDPKCWRRRQIDRLHVDIQDLGKQDGVTYLDLRRAFVLPNGQLDPKRMRGDQVHLKASGLEAWAQAMEPTLREMMGKPLVQEEQPEWLTRTVAVRPTERQVVWQRREFTGFLHFGVNTFTDREWGTGKEDPAIFEPTEIDTDQWVRVAKAAGMKMLILTAKHHDGFCLWQTRYTTHSVASSPWQKGRGDVVKLLAESCRKQGLDLGIYLSPADLYQIENAKGLYGNGSRYTERVIPRPVAGRPFADKRSFRYKVDDYNEYYMNQLFELLTEYGPISEVWLDGAHPKRKGGQTYTYNQWYELIHELAPQAIIFGKGPGCRWIGNEQGGARKSEWSVVPLPVPAREFTWGDMTTKDLGSRARIRNARYLHWYPAEMDTSIRPGWFYHAKQDGHPRSSLERLTDLYLRGVGGNAVLLLNVPPDRRGLIHETDAKRLRAFGKWLHGTFADNLARGARVSAMHDSITHPATVIVDGELDTWWQPPVGINRSALTLTFPKQQTFDLVSLQEQIRQGQRIERFVVEAWTGEGWAHLGAGTTVGHKRLLNFPRVTTSKVRIHILSSRSSPTLSEVGCYRTIDKTR